MERGELRCGRAVLLSLIHIFYSAFAPLLTEKRFVKTVCSAFKKESGLLEYLTEKGEKDVMVCGIMTDFCINATVEAGFCLLYTSSGKRVLVVDDVISTGGSLKALDALAEDVYKRQPLQWRVSRKTISTILSPSMAAWRSSCLLYTS